MASRQHDLICRAAIEVLSSQGARALTHRQVDRVAGLPLGSTSNVFRTRAALVEAVTARLVDDDQAAFSAFQASHPYGFSDPAGSLARYAIETVMNSPQAVLTRIALLGESHSTPTTMNALQGAREKLVRWGEGLMSALGVPEPETTAEFVIDLIDGAMIAAVTLNRPINADALAIAIRHLSIDRIPQHAT